MASNDDLPELPREDASSRTHAPNISRKDDMVRYSTFQKFPKLIINF